MSCAAGRVNGVSATATPNGQPPDQRIPTQNLTNTRANLVHRRIGPGHRITGILSRTSGSRRWLLFRDSHQLHSGLVDLVEGVGHHRGGGNPRDEVTPPGWSAWLAVRIRSGIGSSVPSAVTACPAPPIWMRPPRGRSYSQRYRSEPMGARLPSIASPHKQSGSCSRSSTTGLAVNLIRCRCSSSMGRGMQPGAGTNTS